MTTEEISTFFEKHKENRDRTIVTVDFGNVVRWEASLHWKIGLRELGTLAKHFSGRHFLRRFYYGSDYGPDDTNVNLCHWSRAMLEKATMSGFEVVTKRIKYIHSRSNPKGYEKKCDLDVEMAVDLIRERERTMTRSYFFPAMEI